jgi:hypothetical protein
MPFVPSKKQQQSAYENMTGDSLVSDFHTISSNIPKKIIEPLEKDKERIEKVKPDFYSPERARPQAPDERAPTPKRKPNPPEDSAPVPKRKPAYSPRTMVADSKPWEAEGGNFFDYKRGGGVEDYTKNVQDIVGQYIQKLPIMNLKRGGNTGLAATRGNEPFHNGGLFDSNGAGRTDILNRRVEPGSYVVPADVVSALGDGNTLSGARVLDNMMGTQEEPQEQFMDVPQPNYTMKKGGSVPVVTAGGEYLIKRGSIIRKFGDLKHGHNILDAMVKQVRAQNVKKLRSLPGPRK